MTALPEARGKLLLNEPLGPFTWFRVGGNADALFIPADADDLADFLKALDPAVPVTVLGVGSNVIVRDGGVEGVVIRLAGRPFAGITTEGETITAGAGAPPVSTDERRPAAARRRPRPTNGRSMGSSGS